MARPYPTINHDHQAPFLPWPWSEGSAMTIRQPFCHGQDPKDWPWPSGTLYLVLVVIGFQAWHQAKTSWHLTNILWTPQIFKDSEPPIKWLIGREGGREGAPNPLTPLGGDKVFLFLGGGTGYTSQGSQTCSGRSAGFDLTGPVDFLLAQFHTELWLTDLQIYRLFDQTWANS